MTDTLVELDQDQWRRRRIRKGLPIESEATLDLISAASITPEPFQWIWKDWMAAGKLHILAGPPGTGKTTVAAKMAATLSTGGIWPDGSVSPFGNVLIWSGEDDPSDTLVPRLKAAGADTHRIYFVGNIQERGAERCFDPTTDMPLLMEVIKTIGGLRLIIIDHIVSLIPGDSHKNAEVRRGLLPLVTFASQQGFAILGITHFSKGTGGRDPVERISGSIAFGAMARIVYVTAKLPESEHRGASRILCRSKSNIGPDEGGFRYDLEQRALESHTEILASRVIWGDHVEGSARELLDRAENHREGTDQKASLIRPEDQWLFEFLTFDAQPASHCMEEGLAAGFTRKQLRDARERLGVISSKSGFDGGWVWSLPEGTFKP